MTRNKCILNRFNSRLDDITNDSEFTSMEEAEVSLQSLIKEFKDKKYIDEGKYKITRIKSDGLIIEGYVKLKIGDEINVVRFEMYIIKDVEEDTFLPIPDDFFLDDVFF